METFFHVAILILQVATLGALGSIMRRRKIGPQMLRQFMPPAPPIIPVPDGTDPVQFRPDPTARFNVFRINEGRLCITDEQRYTGNDQLKADQAIEVYESTEWEGEVYAYEHNQLRKRIPR